MYEFAHASALNPHRSAGETFQMLKRMGWWDSMGPDFNRWYSACESCQKYRTKTVQPPLRSTLADDRMRLKLPWSDVLIDAQGPYTMAEGGEKYVLSYTCTSLKVPKLEAMRSLQAGDFSRALVSCVLRSRIIPEVVRSDRGPEMTSRVNQEFLALCGTTQIKRGRLHATTSRTSRAESPDGYDESCTPFERSLPSIPSGVGGFSASVGVFVRNGPKRTSWAVSF